MTFVERISKGIRNPSRDAMLSHATKEMGRGWGIGYGLSHPIFGVFWFVGSTLMGFLYDQHVHYLVIFSVAVQVVALPVFRAARARVARS